MTVRISFAARSEVGHVRSSNEDNLYCNGVTMTASTRERPFFLAGITESPAIFAVCDGMGGEDCGELASLTAVEDLAGHSRNILHNLMDADSEVQKYVTDTNTKLLGIMRRERIQMGTTLALVVAGGNTFTAYNLGDSRIYRVNNGRLLRITDDHTVAEEKMRLGYITAQQAEESRERHMLMRFLGLYDDEVGIAPDINGPFEYGENTRVLLSSDGLNEMLAFRDIAAIMTSSATPKDAVNSLVEGALLNGGRDNVTCIVLEFLKEE